MELLSHPIRPAGAPEFVVFSHKQNERVSLFCRPSLWRFAEVEFDPWVKDVRVNQRFIDVEGETIPVALAYENRYTSIIVLSKSRLGSCSTMQVQKYADDNGFLCEVLDVDFLKLNHIRYENYLLMLSYINKHRESLTERNLSISIKLLPRDRFSLNNAMQTVQQVFPETGAALVFELIRRGALSVQNLSSIKLAGVSLLFYGDVVNE